MVMYFYYSARFSLNLMIFILLFSGCQFKTSYGMKDLERHRRTHTGLCSCICFWVGFLLSAFSQKPFSYEVMSL